MQSTDLFFNKASFVQFKGEDINKQFHFQKVMGEIMKEIGRGAYGVVYKAIDKSNSTLLRAIKKITKKTIKYPTYLKNEIKNLMELDHPSILKIYDIYEDESYLFLVTDYCEGGQLFDKLNEIGSFNQNDARVVFTQLMQALNYCHKNKIAHRDLKPENMLFLDNKSFNMKLIDFGFSYKWHQNMRNEVKKKKQSKMVGTAYYIAPEVIYGEYSEKCDIWSAGVILHVIVSATPPFDGRNERQILASVKKGFYTLDTPQLANVSAQCKDLIKKMLTQQEKRITIAQLFEHPWMKLKELSKNPLQLDFKRLKSYSDYSNMKKLTALFISSKLSQKNIQKLSNKFKQMDEDNDGAISLQQLKHALGEYESAEELKETMNKIDADKNGLINYTEFIASVEEQAKLFTMQNLINCFNSIDLDKNGLVDSEELKQLLECKSDFNAVKDFKEVYGKQLDDLIKECDKNNDGKIDFNQFMATIRK